MSKKIKKLLEKLDIKEDIDYTILDIAITHKSYKAELRDNNILDNERLEFLGDAVLKLSVSNWLYCNYPNASEGQMSTARAYVVSDKSLANVSRRINLSKNIKLGHKEIASGGKEKDSILANCFEAVLGALFICKGFEFTSNLIINLLKNDLINAMNGRAEESNSKDLLQKLTQAKFKILPEYNSFHLDGPPHKAIFKCVLKVLDKEFEAIGKSKKEAEQKAAKLALKEFVND
ncbi:MAG: ribonuclease 3 [Candidatus Sericytochromatia bacterium]|nr:MAG: ribonuclease 3 [Candidatus Sericytochromatia bacterium]